jgi:hypothetical protein
MPKQTFIWPRQSYKLTQNKPENGKYGQKYRHENSLIHFWELEGQTDAENVDSVQ